MDQKCVKKMKKRRDLDKLIGNGRKHIRKKSGHVLLKTDSQSSISSDEIDQVSSIRYHGSRCSSFLTYANCCLSICLLIVCCALIGLILVMRSDLASLQKEVHTATGNKAQRPYDLLELQNRMKSIKIHVHLLNKNLTKQAKHFRRISEKVSFLEKEILHFKSYERFLGSLSDIPTRLNETRDNFEDQSKIIKVLKKKMILANRQIQTLSNDVSGLKRMKEESKASKEDNFKPSASENTSARMNYTVSHVLSLQRNISNLSLRLSHIEKQVIRNFNFRAATNDAKDTSLNGSFISIDDFRGLLERVSLIEMFLHKLENRFDNFTSNSAQLDALHGKQINNTGEKRAPLSQKSASVASIFSNSTNSTLKKIISDVKTLNSSLQHLRENLPDTQLTLGLDAENATSPSKPLGKGVILRRDEYLKWKKNSAEASDAFLISKHSKLRIDALEKKIKSLSKQITAHIKNTRIPEAVELKTTSKSDKTKIKNGGNSSTKKNQEKMVEAKPTVNSLPNAVQQQPVQKSNSPQKNANQLSPRQEPRIEPQRAPTSVSPSTAGNGGNGNF